MVQVSEALCNANREKNALLSRLELATEALLFLLPRLAAIDIYSKKEKKPVFFKAELMLRRSKSLIDNPMIYEPSVAPECRGECNVAVDASLLPRGTHIDLRNSLLSFNMPA